MVNTVIKQYIKWHPTEKSKHQKLVISLWQDNLGFGMFSWDANGKANTKPDINVFFKQLAYDESILANICGDMLSRIIKINKGETVKSSPLFIHNGKKGIGTSTSVVEFDAFNTKKDDTKMEKPIVKVTLKKRNEGDKEWKSESTLFLSDGPVSSVYTTGDTAVKYKESYNFFDSLKSIMDSFANRTSPKREQHWKEFFKEKEKEGNNGQSNSSNKSVQNMDVDDDFDF